MLSLNRGRLRTDLPTGPSLVPLAASPALSRLSVKPLLMHVLKEHRKETAKLRNKKNTFSNRKKVGWLSLVVAGKQFFVLGFFWDV